MSAEFPSLGVIVRKHRIERCSVSNTNNSNSYQWGRCVGCDFVSYTFPIKGINWDVLALEISADHIAEMWREACTVTTPEQRDALPVGTVLREVYDGTIWTLHDGGKHIEAYRECDYLPLLTSAINLPARVIHNPDWETK